MKHLIIYAHPNPQSLNGLLKQLLVEHLHNGEHEVEIRDLYQINFDPVLSSEDMEKQLQGVIADDVQLEQEFIRNADCITFIYPIWWTGLPAILKGYIDRVFSYGFAYRYDQGVQKGLLTGKTTVIINTHGKSEEEYHSIGMDKALLLTSDTGIFSYCGLEIKKHLFFANAVHANKENVEDWISEVINCYE